MPNEKLQDVIPWEKVNKEIKGLPPKGLTILQGKRGQGLNTVGLEVCYNAWKNGYNIIYISLEVTPEEIFEKIKPFGNLPKNNHFQIYTSGKTNQDLLQLAVKALKDIPKALLFIDTLGLYSSTYLRSFLEKSYDFNFPIIGTYERKLGVDRIYSRAEAILSFESVEEKMQVKITKCKNEYDKKAIMEI